MPRILAVADEVDESLGGEALAQLRPDLVLSAGDLPFDYLEYLVTVLNVPLLYVPGNHDPALRERRGELAWPPSVELKDTRDPVGPLGCTNVEGRIEDVAGIRVAGLGGSVRYREGPNQYTQKEMRRRGPSAPSKPRPGACAAAAGSTCCSRIPHPSASATRTIRPIRASRPSCLWSSGSRRSCSCTGTSIRTGRPSRTVTWGRRPW